MKQEVNVSIIFKPDVLGIFNILMVAPLVGNDKVEHERLSALVEEQCFPGLHHGVALSGQKLINEEVPYALRITYLEEDDHRLIPKEWVLYFMGNMGNQVLAEGAYGRYTHEKLTFAGRTDHLYNHLFDGVYKVMSPSGVEAAALHWAKENKVTPVVGELPDTEFPCLVSYTLRDNKLNIFCLEKSVQIIKVLDEKNLEEKLSL